MHYPNDTLLALTLLVSLTRVDTPCCHSSIPLHTPCPSICLCQDSFHIQPFHVYSFHAFFLCPCHSTHNHSFRVLSFDVFLSHHVSSHLSVTFLVLILLMFIFSMFLSLVMFLFMFLSLSFSSFL